MEKRHGLLGEAQLGCPRHTFTFSGSRCDASAGVQEQAREYREGFIFWPELSVVHEAPRQLGEARKEL